MLVDSISLQNFRSFTEATFEPSPSVNVIYGDNAVGKTNFLESIWMFTGCKSFRGTRDSGLVSFDAEFARNEIRFHSCGREQKCVMLIDKKRQASLNGVRLDSVTELFGVFPCVVFAPNHLSLVKGSPADRRKFLDTAICIQKPTYARILSDYVDVLAQRNSLLKAQNSPYFSDMLDILDSKISACSRAVSDVRYAFINELFEAALGVYDGISNNKEKLKLRYVSVLPKDFSGGTYEEMYRMARAEDLENGYTKYGPHRDDIEIIIDGKSAKGYGSQGQQRSAALALKLASAGMIEKKIGEKPIILLDDVMSELDACRQDYILNRLVGFQVFITCCDKNAVKQMENGKMFHVKQ